MIKISPDRKYSAIYNFCTRLQKYEVKVRSNESGVFVEDTFLTSDEELSAMFKKYNCVSSDLRQNLYSGTEQITLEVSP